MKLDEQPRETCLAPSVDPFWRSCGAGRVDHSTGPARTLFIVGTFYASLHLALRPQSNSLFPHMSDANNYHPLLMVPFHGWVGKGSTAIILVLLQYPVPRYRTNSARSLLSTGTVLYAVVLS